MTISSDVETQFVGLESPTAPRFGHGQYPCQGLYWTPKGKRPKVAFIATHYNVDFMEHYLASYLAARGYGFLGWNTRFRGAEDQFLLEHALIDISVGMKWLKEKAGVETIVLLGNSGGGSLMAAYQAESQNPTLAADMKGIARDTLQTLPGANFYISLNAHPGRPEVLTNWMDGSVIDETDPTKTDESLNPFNKENGPPFSQEFITRYRAAQRARNQRITDWAKAELARLNAAGIPDRTFAMFRTWADLRFIDPSIEPSTRKCPGCYRGDPETANRAPAGIGRANTLKTWLSMWSLETSKCLGPEHLKTITMPSLVIQSTGDMGVFASDAKVIFDSIGAKDKVLEAPPGGHYFEEKEEYRVMATDIITGWLQPRL